MSHILAHRRGRMLDQVLDRGPVIELWHMQLSIWSDSARAEDTTRLNGRAQNTNHKPGTGKC